MEVSRLTNNGLVVFVIAAVLVALVVNAFLAKTGWPDQVGPTVVPEGWKWVDQVVASVWVLLFAAMGASAWLAYSSKGSESASHGRLVVALIVICALYPLHTTGLQVIPGLVGNVVVMILTLGVAIVIWRSSRLSSVLLAPVAAWLAVATIYLVKLISVNTPTT